MDTLYALAAVLVVSSISGLAALFYPSRALRSPRALILMVGLAVGALLGDAFIHLIPEAFETLGAATGVWVLVGIGTFFVLEKLLHWHHHHTTHDEAAGDCEDCETHVAPFGKLVIASDILHNVIDGIIIVGGFLVSPSVGIATTLAVVLHEIPQEIGDYGVLLHAGFSRGRALFANIASSLSAFLGAGLALFLGTTIEGAIPAITALAAGAFIYIAAADLVPELHKVPHAQESILQLMAILVGVGLMFSLLALETEREHGPDPDAPAITSSYTSKEQSPEPGALAFHGTVATVVDGDTIRIVHSGRTTTVRLIGVDAPETNAGKSRRPECYAHQATEALRSLAPEGTLVTLETDPTQDTYDTYGRLLAYVFVGTGLDREQVNEALVALGAAKEYTFKGRPYQHRAAFMRAEAAAHDMPTGLWAVCP